VVLPVKKDRPVLLFLELAGRQFGFDNAFSNFLRGTALCGVVTQDDGQYE
jgi:hypothetical protein